MWANALKCIEQLAKPQYASFVLCITAATTSVASVVLLHNKNCQNCQSGGNICTSHTSLMQGTPLPRPLFISLSTPPTAFDIIAKFHFRRGLTGNVHVPPLLLFIYLSLSLSFYACLSFPLPSLFPSLFLTIFMFQYFIICSKRILCCCSLVLLQNYLCIMLAKWAWH